MNRDLLPTPLLQTLHALDADAGQPFRAVHRLVDAVEVLVKLHTVAAVSQFTSRPEVTGPVRVMLAAGLRSPVLGVWWQFARESTKALVEEGEPLFLPGMERYLLAGGPLGKALDGNDNLIAFRNSYAHGATPDDANCAADLTRIRPRLESLLASADHLVEASLVAVLDDGRALEAVGSRCKSVAVPPGATLGHCYLVRSDGAVLDLHPLIVWRPAAQGEDGVFFFYNDLRDNAAGILNYHRAIHRREKRLREELLERYPIDVWSKADVEFDPFRERIESLTEVFKGRRDDLGAVLRFLAERSHGFLMVWGKPGVGKSALLARLDQVLRWAPEAKSEAYPDLTFPDAKVHVVEYFVRRGSTDRAEAMVDSLEQRLEARWRTGIPLGAQKGGTLQQRLAARFASVAAKLGESERLVLLIDGLDEATDDPAFLSALPREVPEGVLVLYASRPVPAVRHQLYEQLEREQPHEEYELRGLSVADTRALLSEHVSKYALQQGYVEVVRERSEGNPLYLKLLCQGLVSGVFALNDAGSVPKTMLEVYEPILRRLAQVPMAIDLLTLHAAAIGFVTPVMMAQLLGADLAIVREGPLAACAEVLYENPLTETVEDYQLFHESLREHLRKELAADVLRWEGRLADWCAEWRRPDGDPRHDLPERRYALAFAAPHLDLCRAAAATAGRQAESQRLEDRILGLVEDASWREATFRACGNAAPLRRALRIAQDCAVRRDRGGSEVGRVLRFAWWLFEEERRLYDRQRADLRRADVPLGDVAELAAMGQLPRDRVMLAVRALWAAGRSKRVPAGLQKQVESWLEESRDPVLVKLWQLVVA